MVRNRVARDLMWGFLTLTFAVLSGCFSNNPEEPEVPSVEEPAFASQWTWRNPLPHGHNMGAIVANDSIRLIFSGAGFMRSVKGGAWEIHQSSVGLSAAVWTGSRFIGVGNNRFATSSDGLTWTVQQLRPDTVHIFNDVVWTGSQAVAVGWGYPEAAIFTSPDGLVWTERSSVGAVNLHAVTWTGSLLVAVGSAGELRTSPDGITWTARPKAAENGLSDIVWTGTQVVAVGGDQGTIRTSPDGITWSSHTPGATNDHSSFSSIIWTGNQLVASKNNGKLLTSANGVDWTLQAKVPFTINHLAWTGEEVIAVGEDGALFTSPSGVTWTSHVSGSRQYLTSVVWAGNKFVAVGFAGTVMTSADGITWAEGETGVARDLEALVWTGQQLVAVGDSGAILTSPDGITWTMRTSGTFNRLVSVASSSTLLVAAGVNGTLLTSPDGISWTARVSGTTEYLNCLLWDGTRWLAGGSNGMLLESGDGTAWTSEQIDAPLDFGDGFIVGAWFSSIVRTDREYIVTVPGFHPVRGGYLLTSSDGTKWTRRYGTPLARGFWLNGRFVGIADGTDYPTEATIMVGDTGNAWISKGLGTTNPISSIAWGKGKLVAVGYKGTIISSP